MCWVQPPSILTPWHSDTFLALALSPDTEVFAPPYVALAAQAPAGIHRYGYLSLPCMTSHFTEGETAAQGNIFGTEHSSLRAEQGLTLVPWPQAGFCYLLNT